MRVNSGGRAQSSKPRIEDWKHYLSPGWDQSQSSCSRNKASWCFVVGGFLEDLKSDSSPDERRYALDMLRSSCWRNHESKRPNGEGHTASTFDRSIGPQCGAGRQRRQRNLQTWSSIFSGAYRRPSKMCIQCLEFATVFAKIANKYGKKTSKITTLIIVHNLRR